MIIIDDRAGSKDLLSSPRLQSISVPGRLDSGDVCFPGFSPAGPVLIGVEVKSVSDLIDSIKTGRLQDQLRRMASDYNLRWLVVYGGYTYSVDGMIDTGSSARPHYKSAVRQVPASMLETYLISMEVSRGVMLRQVPDYDSVSLWVSFLHKFFSKPWDQHRSITDVYCPRVGLAAMPRTDQSDRRRVRMIAQLAGVGLARAEALAAKYKSIAELCSATVSDLAKVSGIGKVLANSIVRQLHHED